MRTSFERETKVSVARFLERLAVYCKLGLVYPPGNQRLARAEVALRQELVSLADDSGRVVFRLVGNEAVLFGEGPEPAGNAGLWLKERFERSGLAGLEVEADVPAASLLSFAQALAGASRSKEKGIAFDRLWPEEFPGLRLLEACYRFDGAGGNEEHEVRVAAELLAGNEPLRARVDALLSTLAVPAREEPFFSSDSIYQDVAGALPREVLVSPESTLEAAERLIERALLAAKGGDLEQIVQALGGALFGLADTEIRSSAVSSDFQVPAESDVSGEIGPVLESFQGLPCLPAGWSLESQALSPTEALSVGLELLAGASPEEAALMGLKSLLGGILSRPGSKQIDLVHKHLGALLGQSAEEADRARALRLWENLERLGHGRFLVETRLISPALLAATFPGSFLLFFDSLDLHQAADRRLLQQLMNLLSEEALETGGAPIAQGLQEAARLERLAQSCYPELLPLVGILFCRGEFRAKRQAIRFLHQLELDPRASAAFRLVGPPELLPPRYIWELCRAVPGSPALARARGMAGSILRSFLAPTGEPSPTRLQVIAALAEFPGEETLELLGSLAKGRGFLRLFGPPRTEREAARLALQRIEVQAQKGAS